MNRLRLSGSLGRGLMLGGLVVAALVAVALLRSVSATQVESYYLAGRDPVSRFRIATYYGSVSEIWVLPVAGTPLDELIALPRFENTWPFSIYEAYADDVSVADVIVSDALRAQLRDLLAAQEESAVQVVIKAECGRVSMRTNNELVEYLVVAPACQ